MLVQAGLKLTIALLKRRKLNIARKGRSLRYSRCSALTHSYQSATYTANP